MDTEEHQMLVREKLRCRIVEADRDAESLRAQKYREILSELSSEDVAAPHPQAASISPAPEGASVCPASPPPSSHLVRSTRVRSTRERASVRPHRAQSTGVGTSSRAGRVEVVVPTTRLSNLRKPNSASINRSAQGSRKTHPSHGVSRSSGTNDRLVQTQTTGGHMTWRRTMPTLSTFRLHSPRNSGASNAALMAENLALLGLIPFELTRAEATRAKETPGISSVEFYRKFGGGRGMEWLKCHMIPSYADVLCADSSTSQPYVPIDIGKPGLVLRPPAAPQSKRRTFHVFSCSLHDKLLYYRGEYTTVPLPDVQLTWFDIPGTCREAWTKRIAQTVTPAMRAIRARIKLRDELEREPSTTEIEEYLLGRSNVEVTYKEVGSALRAGEEKMVYEGIQCTGYDSNLATLIQRSTGL